MRKTLFCSVLFAIALAAVPHAAAAGVSVGISVNIAPPALPAYTQPLCPGDGYIWTPGYWGWGNGAYLWHAGYWGPHVGFYGGINYGFGYVGVGYAGGRWDHGVFAYNRAVKNVNVTIIHNTYNQRVIERTTVNHVSFNGGRGGVNYRPSRDEDAYSREQHFGPSGDQERHERAASSNRAQFASVNHGKPGFAATGRPGEFNHGNSAPRGNLERNNGANNAARENNNRPSNQNSRQSGIREGNRVGNPQSHGGGRPEGGQSHGGAPSHGGGQPQQHGGGGGGNEHHGGGEHH